jgi:hypothetical protein
MKLSLAFSPCPNDCFMFDAIVHRRIDLEGLEFSVTLADIEALNHAAFAGEPDVTKISFHAYAYCADRYVLLDAGSALGRNCGPLLISRRPIDRAEVERGDLAIAIPGRYTTANLLCGLAFPNARNKSEVVFSEIESAVLAAIHSQPTIPTTAEPPAMPRNGAAPAPPVIAKLSGKATAPAVPRIPSTKPAAPPPVSSSSTKNALGTPSARTSNFEASKMLSPT